MLSDTRRTLPDAIAVEDHERRLTYRELDLLTDELAGTITTATCGAPSPVALRLQRGVDMLVALLGILKAGCWYVPIGRHEPDERARRMLDLSGARHAIVDADPGPAFAGLTRIGIPRTATPTAESRPLPTVDPEQPVYVLFTSGSSGEPKGVEVNSASVVNRIRWACDYLGLRPDDRILQKTPYTFDVSGWEFFCPLTVGAACVFLREDGHREPGEVAAFIADRGITACHFVPTMLGDFLRVATPAQVAGVRVVCCSGEALSAPLCRDFHRVFAAELHNLYGPTEAAIDVTAWRVPPDVGPTDTIYIGAPIDNAILCVTDGSGAPVPLGESGELWIGGLPVANRYVGRPDLTDQAFVTLDGRRYYRTGDRMRIVDGLLEYQGRLDDQVKIRGVRIEVGEVEAALSNVDEAGPGHVVVLHRDAGPELHAALPVRKDVPRPSEAVVRTGLARLVPAAYLPQRIWWFDTIPMLSSGKADRAAIRAEITRRLAEDDHTGDPLGRIWRAALGPVDDHDGFVTSGGYSLSALRVVAAIRAELGVELPLPTLLADDASLEQVRAAVARAPRADPVRPRDDAVSGPIPLTAAQRALRRIGRIHDGAAPYNVVGALRLTGTVDTARLQEAVNELVARYECLRVRVAGGDGDDAHWVETAARLTVRVEDADGPLTEAAVDAFVRRVGLEVFDPDRGPLTTIALLRDGEHAVLVLSIHHLLADQATLDLLLGDLGRAYAGVPVPAGDTSFGPYAVRATRYQDSAACRADLDYWMTVLADVPHEPALPFVRRPAAPRSLLGDARRTVFTDEWSDRLDRFCRTHGTTALTVFLACLARVLSAWSGHDAVVVGIPVSQRQDAADDRVGGYLLNTVPLRIDATRDESMISLLEHVRGRVAGALVHGSAGFERILDALGVRPSPLGNALFQIWVNDLTRAAGAPDFGDLEVELHRTPGYAALFDLNLYLRQDDGRYDLELVAAAETVDAALPVLLLDQVTEVLDQLLADPYRPLTAYAWRAPATLPATPPEPPATGLLEQFLDAARANPDAVALRDAGQDRRYRDLVADVDAVATRLRAAGVGPGDVTAVLGRRRSALVTTLLAVWSLDAVPAVVDAGHPEAVRAELVRTVRPAAVATVTADGGVDIVSAAGGHRVTDGRGHILCTTGTGGKPAAVYVRDEVLAAQLAWLTRLIGLTAEDHIGLLAGIGHDPLLRNLLPLTVGGTVVVPPEGTLTDPRRLGEFVRDHGLSVLYATPALLELLAAAHEDTGHRYPSLRLIISTGAALTAGLADRVRAFADARLINGYGTTETPQIASWQDVTDLTGLPAEEILPFGTGAPGGPLRVVDEYDRDCPPGQLGEIVVQSRYLGTYVAGGKDGFIDGLPGRPGAAFRTGDFGRRDPAGNVVIAGRRDRQILINGFRGTLEEIERAALRHGGVRQAVAVLNRTALGDVLDLRVVAAPGRTVDQRDLAAQLGNRLPHYLVPARVQVVSALDTDHNHKVVAGGGRPAVPQPPVLGDQPGVAGLNRLIEPLLGRPLPADVNFFDAGLNSIMLLRFHGVLTEALRRPMPVATLFAHPTLAELAAWLAGETPDTSAVVGDRRPEAGRSSRAERRRAVRAVSRTNRGDHGE
ncbi:amino acid adenylation domain-containing protein [Krasilnikovia sp. M28-CT-15]|uniref:amino acid adenylation domain-containing protein n=1 Tax=Krasilnikovia sp. M28-CT-15 TaxID=3373540 RepID=UPI0038777BC5